MSGVEYTQADVQDALREAVNGTRTPAEAPTVEQRQKAMSALRSMGFDALTLQDATGVAESTWTNYEAGRSGGPIYEGLLRRVVAVGEFVADRG